MISIVLLVIAAICFFVAAINETLLDQGPADLVAWGLFFWVCSQLLAGGLVIYEKRQGQ